MPEMQSYMGVNEGNDGIIGKLLYYSTANILIPKDKFIELGKAFNLPKVKPARESAASAYRYATTALTLYERFKSCYNSDHVDSVIQFLLKKMQAVKINIHGNLYFIPSTQLPLLNILEDYIEALA